MDAEKNKPDDIFPDWTEVELLTAALHHEECEGATVEWSQTIEGRQFDVTVRHASGFHEYLTVVECRNKKAKVPVGEVDAFVTKSQDVLANKAVMVSTSGYQSGGIEVAKRHGIVLLNLVERNDADPRADDISVVTTLKNIKTGERIYLGHGQNANVELLDPRLQKSLATKYALVDQGGNTVSEAFLTDLRLGRWQEVEVGKFYRQPVVNGYYFCEGMSPAGMVTWILIETFQHGELIQARMEQRQEYNSLYHLVTDKDVIRRLENRLVKYWRKCPPGG